MRESLVRERIGRLAVISESAVLLVAIMFCGSLALWIGVPIGWLWVGSQVQDRSGSLSVAVGAMMIGMIVTITTLVAVLTRLDRRYGELAAADGNDADEAVPVLELILVGSAVCALVGFAVWFFGFSGSSPIPLNIGY